MIFNQQAWKEFKLSDVFEFSNCKCKVARELSDGDDYFYIGAKKNDNGIMRRVAYDESLTTKGNCIIFICDGQGSVGYTNYMDKDFIGSTTLSAGRNPNLNEYSGMFLVSVLDLERPKYSFGRKYRTKLKQATIMLPATTSGDVDWTYMENYIRSIANIKLPTTNVGQADARELIFEKWEDFKIGDLFKLERCKNIASSNLTDGNDCYYLGAKKNDNGVMRRVKREEGLITKGNCIVFIGNGQGSVGFANYMNRDFIGSADLTAGYSEHLNKYTGMFLITLLDLERSKYSFGRKWSARIADTTIRLPAKDNAPDWAYMENYIKSLPYSDRI